MSIGLKIQGLKCWMNQAVIIKKGFLRLFVLKTKIMSAISFIILIIPVKIEGCHETS